MQRDGVIRLDPKPTRRPTLLIRSWYPVSGNTKLFNRVAIQRSFATRPYRCPRHYSSYWCASSMSWAKLNRISLDPTSRWSTKR